MKKSSEAVGGGEGLLGSEWREGGGGDGVVYDGDVETGGSGVLAKSAKSFLKRMAKAFAGGGGGGGGGGGDDTWDAAQTVRFRCLGLGLLQAR
jgi:hypothetical protein